MTNIHEHVATATEKYEATVAHLAQTTERIERSKEAASAERQAEIARAKRDGDHYIADLLTLQDVLARQGRTRVSKWLERL